MIVFYQRVTKPLTSKDLPNEPCPVCGKKGGIQVTLYMKYLACLLPVYGLGRRTGVHCSFCAHEIKKPDAPFLVKQNYSLAIVKAIKDIRASYKRSLWQLLYPWTLCWCFLLLVAVGWVYGMGARHRMSQTREFLANPRSGDIYKARWTTAPGAERGVLVKLNKIEGDTLFVSLSKKSIPVSYNADDWRAFSSEENAFLPQVYKLNLPRFKESKAFYAYAPEETNAGQPADSGAPADKFAFRKNLPATSAYIGEPLHTGEHSDIGFDIVERKKQD